jgi:ribosomal protein S18 acetylase RimI-like enzyme
MTEYSIRHATTADVDALLDVYETVAAEARWIGGELPVDRPARREQRIRNLAREDFLDLAVEAGGRIVGELAIETRGGRGDLGMLLLKQFRGLGIGSALMTAAIEWARGRRLDKIFLEAWPHNAAAIALYEKFGFVREGYHPKQYRRRSGEAWDSVSMGLVL